MSVQQWLVVLIVVIYLILGALVASYVASEGMPFGIRSRVVYLLMLVFSPIVSGAYLVFLILRGLREVAIIIAEGWQKSNA